VESSFRFSLPAGCPEFAQSPVFPTGSATSTHSHNPKPWWAWGICICICVCFVTSSLLRHCRFTWRVNNRRAHICI